AKIRAALIAGTIAAGLFFFAFQRLGYQWNWSALVPYRAHLFFGWLMTVCISAGALALSSLIGLAFTLARRSPILSIRYLGNIYVELVRGTPLLVQILIFFYVVAEALHVSNRYFAGVVIL